MKEEGKCSVLSAQCPGRAKIRDEEGQELGARCPVLRAAKRRDAGNEWNGWQAGVAVWEKRPGCRLPAAAPILVRTRQESP
jgi:hypothetical protein